MVDQLDKASNTSPENTQFVVEPVTVVSQEGGDTNLLYQVKRANNGKVDNNAPIVSFYPFSGPASEGGEDKHIFPAWAGARTSRTRKTYAEIFDEVLELTKMDPQAAALKIREFGLSYGHQSILGMVPIFLFFNNVSLEQAYWIFNHLWYGDGQESSSRYVKFSKMNFPRIEELLDFSVIPEAEAADIEFIIQEWYAILAMAENNYKNWYTVIEEAYTQQFSSEGPIEKSTLQARTLDVVRSWIPLGATTSMCLLGNLRIWNNYIKILQETNDPEYQALATQIKAALRVGETEEGRDVNANLAPLIKHTEPTFVIKNNVARIKDYVTTLPGFANLLLSSQDTQVTYSKPTQISMIDRTSVGVLTIMQYILIAYPSLTENQILQWLSSLDKDTIRSLSMIVFNQHTRHEKMGVIGDIRGDRIFIVQTAIAQLRDLNRHRTLGRTDIDFLSQIDYSPEGYVDYEQMIRQGFNTSSKILETDGLTHLKAQWNQDADAYYERLMSFYKFLEARFDNPSLRVIRKLLPLGHNTRMHFSASPTSLDYLLDQRSTGGNDLSNIEIMQQIIGAMDTDPSLAGLSAGIAEFDYNSETTFKDRT